MEKRVFFAVLDFGILCGILIILGAGLVSAQLDSAKQGNGSQVVLLNGTINGSGLAIATGESWDLYQGYALHVLGIDLAQSRIMIRLLHDNDVVSESWIQVGDSFIYAKQVSVDGMRGVESGTGGDSNNDTNHSSNGVTILSVSIDSLYEGDTRDLVMLYPIYQYLDTDYETPAIDVLPSPRGNEPNKTPLNNNSKESPSSGISIVIPIMLIVALCIQIKNRNGT